MTMTQTEPDPRFPSLAIKTVVCHTVTYFLMGALAYYFLDYAEAFARPELICWMRPTDDPLVRVGVLFQPIRGLLFASVIFPLRSILFRTRGWMVMSWMLVAVGVLSTFGPPPGSVEGMIYTQVPIGQQLAGWLEVIPQAVLLSLTLHHWVRHPERRWLGILMWILFALVIFMATAALVAGPPAGS